MIVFDLDGTLTESKSNIEPDMSSALGLLLAKKQVSVIGGGSYAQFEQQLLAHLSCAVDLLKNLFLFPTSGSRLYVYENGWRETYAHTLSLEEKQNIFDAFERVFKEMSYEHPHKVYGDIFEDRGTQIAFSPLGQNVILEIGSERGVALKQEWNKRHDSTRQAIVRSLQQTLPEFEVRAGGLTTIDVTRKGIDKAYGIRQIETLLKIPKSKMLFAGDALYEGGNDYPVFKEGVDAVSVKRPSDTKQLIEALLAY